MPGAGRNRRGQWIEEDGLPESRRARYFGNSTVSSVPP